MNREELISLLDEVREEIRIFERPSVDNSKKMLELLTEVVVAHPLPPAEGAEANRASIDDLIKKHIPIDAANFEYCAKHNIINGGLLQGIRDVVNSFMKPQPTAEGAEEILDEIDLGEPLQTGEFYYRSEVLEAMNKFATLHAQRIAEKMVEERMEQYKAQFKDRPNPLEVNPYDSKGIKRIRNRKIH